MRLPPAARAKSLKIRKKMMLRRDMRRSGSMRINVIRRNDSVFSPASCSSERKRRLPVNQDRRTLSEFQFTE
jgi:hypothetical protein